MTSNRLTNQALFPCVEHLQKRVDAGDFRLFVFDMSSTPALLRAEAYLELGDYSRAIAEARTAYARTQDRNAYHQIRIYAVTALALAHALNGDRTQALKPSGKLEGISTSYPNTLHGTDTPASPRPRSRSASKQGRWTLFLAKDAQNDGMLTVEREPLRQAQLHVKATKPHPFFWAAFQLTGSDR